MSPADPASHRTTRVFHLATAFTFVTIALGSVVCATDSSSACPAWPVCYSDQMAPDLQSGWLHNPAIEFVHRLISFTALVLLAASAWLGRHARDVRVRLFPRIALALAIASAVFGMMLILFTLPMALGLLDVGGAVVAGALIAVAAQARTRRDRAPEAGVWRLGVAAFVVLVVMHLLGIVIAGRTPDGFSSFTRCLSWPVWQVLDIDGAAGPQLARMGLTVVAIILIALAVLRSLRHDTLRAPALALAAGVTAELALGLLISSQGLHVSQTNGINATLAVAYVVLAVAILAALAVLVGRALPAAADDAEAPAWGEHPDVARTG